MTDTAKDRPTPSWFEDAKLGIFIHWTASAIPAYAPVPQSPILQPTDEWGSAERELPSGTAAEDWGSNSGVLDFPVSMAEWRAMPEAEMYHHFMNQPDTAIARYHAERYGDLEFDAFVDRFRTTMIPGWDPEAWADLFARAGARYVVLCTKVEDGFLMWPSSHPNPYKPNWQSERDVVGELAAAVRARGLRFGVYYSGGWDFTFGGADGTRMSEMMPPDPAYTDYVEKHWHELIERYRPDILWNDYGSSPAGLDIEALFQSYYEKVPDGVVNDRFDWSRQPTAWSAGNYATELPADFVTPEMSSTSHPTHKWEACYALGHGFGFNREETDEHYIRPTDLIHRFADIVARGGNLLLNVGPTGSGTIPWLQAERLLSLGQWLATDGEAIYDSRVWEQPEGMNDEGLHLRYTRTDEAVYAVVLGAPRTATVELNVRLSDDVTVELLGWHGRLPWQSTPNGTLIELPEPLDRRPACTLRLTPAELVSPLSESHR